LEIEMEILSAAWLVLNGPTQASIDAYRKTVKRDDAAEEIRSRIMRAAWGYNSSLPQLAERCGMSRNGVAGHVRQLVKEGRLHSYRIGGIQWYSVVVEKFKEDMCDD
jgi:hypothetical protein